jgi:glyoxylase-like metal-dependent hydrolase (beta-lactamase superfamily II)
MTGSKDKMIRVYGNSYYIPSMSNAGFFKGYLIDPGSTGYMDLSDVEIHSVLITHGHNDHFRKAFEFRNNGARVIASKDDALLVRNPEVNLRGLFSWAKPPMEMVTHFFQGNACEVDDYIEDWKDSSIKAYPLPGHTLGMYGFITEDGVFYTGDALYSEDIWTKYKLPYSIDRELCTKSIEKIKKLDYDYVVPGHGVPMKRDEAIRAADFHLEQLDRVDNIILELVREPVSTEDLVTKFSNRLGLYQSINNYWLTVVMLKGHLSSLIDKRKVAYKLENYCMYWYKLD